MERGDGIVFFFILQKIDYFRCYSVYNGAKFESLNNN